MRRAFFYTSAPAQHRPPCPLRGFLLTAIGEEIDRKKNRRESERRCEEYIRTGIADSLAP